MSSWLVTNTSSAKLHVKKPTGAFDPISNVCAYVSAPSSEFSRGQDSVVITGMTKATSSTPVSPVTFIWRPLLKSVHGRCMCGASQHQIKGIFGHQTHGMRAPGAAPAHVQPPHVNACSNLGCLFGLTKDSMLENKHGVYSEIIW